MINIPIVTVEQMREVDRLMVEEIGVSIIMMMENASRSAAVLTRTMLGGSVKGKRIVILCGKGNNGGDGLGAARHLINLGAYVTVFLTNSPQELGKDAKIQYKVLVNTNAHIYSFNSINSQIFKSVLFQADLLVDALLGYNLQGSPREPIATMIRDANGSSKPILAVDIPSGLQADTGKPLSPTIKANTTLTLALPKVGLLTEKAREYVGELHVADLSVHKSVYDRLGIDVPLLFEHEEIVKVK